MNAQALLRNTPAAGTEISFRPSPISLPIRVIFQSVKRAPSGFMVDIYVTDDVWRVARDTEITIL